MPAAQAVDAGTALSALSKAMQDDAGLAWSWHCNIAMTAQDAGAPHDRANVWAADFMRRAFDVDTLTRVREMPAAQAEAKVADDVVRDYPEGWVFHSADFSMAASCPARSGRVTLVRDLAGRDWWLSLSEEDSERVPLYVYGSGNTLSDAIKDAAMLAAKAKGE